MTEQSHLRLSIISLMVFAFQPLCLSMTWLWKVIISYLTPFYKYNQPRYAKRASRKEFQNIYHLKHDKDNLNAKLQRNRGFQ